jgi:hypothetical protein
MAYKLKGSYAGSCPCAGICPCPVDGTPTTSNGECRAVHVFNIAEGNLNDAKLDGVTFALYTFNPKNLTSGNWKVGLVIDEGATADQAKAVESILAGKEGGPFGQFAPLIGEFIGTERAKVTLKGNTGTVAGKSEFTFEPLLGGDGKTPTTIRNAILGWAPEFTIGKATGKSNAFGLTFQPTYGEIGDYEFSSEPVAGAATGGV